MKKDTFLIAQKRWGDRLKITTVRGKIAPLGVSEKEGGIQFVFISACADCGVILYMGKSGRKTLRIPFPEEYRVGNIHTMLVNGIEEESFLYSFYEGEREVADVYARSFAGNSVYGNLEGVCSKKARYKKTDYDWEGDRNPRIPYEQAFIYGMHVRGFTKHVSSGVRHRGTFSGILEKLPYLKDLGVTTLELQPVYEFDEVYRVSREESRRFGQSGRECEEKKNYWGYAKGYYYSPKSSYAASEDAGAEFRDLIKELHRNHMEAVLQFYFPEQVREWEISDILRYWVTEYHVDGFHLKGQCVPVALICEDPCFADTKIWYYDFPESGSRQENPLKAGQPKYRNLGIYRDDFCYTMRRFLKGDEGLVGTVLQLMRCQPEGTGQINYLSSYEGFTLMDLVSYDRKHNEANGEDNRDGNDFNCSWNCGAEGKSRKKAVNALRLKQIRNALSLLVLSQGSPMIFMGDEFGNSQEGNNNPYGQDNEITWLDWRDLNKNRGIYEFLKKLLEVRSEHPILRKESQMRLMDYISCGYPDLSYHGEVPWRPNMEYYSRQAGILLCGKYARINRTKEDDFFYIGLNMHWERHAFALPKLPKELEWTCALGTGEEIEISLETDGQHMELPPRSIYLLRSKVREKVTFAADSE